MYWIYIIRWLQRLSCSRKVRVSTQCPVHYRTCRMEINYLQEFELCSWKWLQSLDRSIRIGSTACKGRPAATMEFFHVCLFPRSVSSLRRKNPRFPVAGRIFRLEAPERGHVSLMPSSFYINLRWILHFDVRIVSQSFLSCIVKRFITILGNFGAIIVSLFLFVKLRIRCTLQHVY